MPNIKQVYTFETEIATHKMNAGKKTCKSINIEKQRIHTTHELIVIIHENRVLLWHLFA